MKVLVAMPVVLQHQCLLNMTLECLRRIESKAEVKVHIYANRLTFPDARYAMRNACRFPVTLHTDRERSVAGSWNAGVHQARQTDASHLLILANDSMLEPGTIDTLLAQPGICSAVPENGLDVPDFSCILWPMSAFTWFGEFDENFRPAYFEDNDAAVRVLLSGHRLGFCREAKFTHLISQTIRHDPEYDGHVGHWMPKNADYFRRKWGHVCPLIETEASLERFHSRPFNDPARPLTYWPIPT